MALRQQLANTQDLVEIEEIRDGAVILKNGGLRQVVMVSGINTALMAEAELDTLTAGYLNFLNGLEFSIQIIIHSRKVNIEKYLDALEERKRIEPSALLQNQIDEYKEFISGFVKDNAIMEKTFLIVIPFTPLRLPGKEAVGGVAKLIPFLNKEDKNKEAEERKNKEAEFTENLNQLIQRTGQVVEGLRTLGLEAIPLDNQSLVELFYNFYNPETVEKEMRNIPTDRLEVELQNSEQDESRF